LTLYPLHISDFTDSERRTAIYSMQQLVYIVNNYELEGNEKRAHTYVPTNKCKRTSGKQ